jgi:starch synthase
MLNPYGPSVAEAYGKVRGLRHWICAMQRAVAPYLATPLIPLAWELRRERCDAVLCQEYEYARFDVCVALGKFLGLPVFATFQGGDWQCSPIERFLRPLTLKACAGLIVGAQTEGKRVRSRYGVSDSRIALVFNPLDLAMWETLDRGVVRESLGIPSSTRVVVWHGRVDTHRKGLDILLDAWQRVAAERNGADLRLILLGTGNDADQLRQHLSTMPCEGVVWVDEYVLDRSVIRRYLYAADVYALPSRHEGFPVALLEAMACGLPVVSTDVSGVPDILEGGKDTAGIIVERDNAAALASALGSLLDDPIRCRAMGACALQRVRARFSLETIGLQLRTFFASRMVSQ